jgi:tRNA-Thr(GGU) m(6)t(6)A37 methyltransferase TsaA
MNSIVDDFSAQTFNFQTIGVIESCFKEKFGVPRQPGLAPSAVARLKINTKYATLDAFEGLENCSHIWIQFVFHQFLNAARTKVRPPRLGGNSKMGVFATRSPNRPNPIGLSVVKLLAIQKESEGLMLYLSGVDLLDGTPVLDIKPYVPYVDIVPEALNSFAASPPNIYPVLFSEEAAVFCREYIAPDIVLSAENFSLSRLIKEVLQQDPRPQYQKLDSSRIYGMRIFNIDVHWRYLEENVYQKKTFSIWVSSIAYVDT